MLRHFKFKEINGLFVEVIVIYISNFKNLAFEHHLIQVLSAVGTF